MKMEGKEEKLVTTSYVHVFKVLLIGLLQLCILLLVIVVKNSDQFSIKLNEIHS